MVRKYASLLFLCLLVAPLAAYGADWTQPTPEELKMTSDPAAPDAPAVFLFREEKWNDRMHDYTTYARIKILTEKGKEMFADVEIPYVGGDSKVDIAGRTIHTDGTVIPLTAKPMDKLVVKTGNYKVMQKVFTMPDVEIGSILEYRWTLRYYANLPARWYIVQPVFVHKAHYYFYPTETSMYTGSLPAGVKVTQTKEGGYDLVVENIAALPNEDYMPPFKSFSPRVIFYYYSSLRTSDEYWKELGKYWSKDVDHFANPSGRIRSAVGQIIAPGDSDEKKVEKIYDEVMKIENTSFTRTHSAKENKAEHLKVKSADDIWGQKRGTDDDITLLFIAMVRAAGLKAYAMIVVNRDQNMFQPRYLDWEQLDDELAIVVIGGKEVYFDPGQRYCAFGKLHWKHTWASGVRQSNGDTQIATTPGLNYKDTMVDRYAELTLDPDGKVHGVIRIDMTGTEALHWRHAALSGDQDEAKKAFDQYLQQSVPSGVEVKTNHFVGLTDYKGSLMAVADVSGSLGTSTGKRVFVPAVFFEGGAKPLFAQQKRESAVDLHYPYGVHDQVTLALPPNLAAESVPKESNVSFTPNAEYIAKFVVKGNTYAYGRLMVLGNAFYTVAEYPELRGFYQKANAEDQAQLVLQTAPVVAATPAGDSK